MHTRKVALNNTFYYTAGKSTKENWENIIRLFPNANLYQTWSYGNVRWGGENLHHLVLYNENQIVAAAQARIMKLPVLGAGIAYISCGPMRKRCGNPGEHEIFKFILRALYNEYVKKMKLYLRIVPFDPDHRDESLQSIFQYEKFRQDDAARRYRTLLVDLSPSLDDLLMKLKKKWRKSLRRAQKEKIFVKEGTDIDLFVTFTKLYQEMHARKGFTENLDIEDFHKIQTDLPDDLRYRILVAYSDNRPVSAMVWSVIGDTGIILFSATGDDGLKLNSSYLLRWIMLQKMKEHGCLFLDQGGIDPTANPGGYLYKKGFGGEDIQHIGTFFACENIVSLLAVSFAEFGKKFLQNLRGINPANKYS